MKQLSTLQGVSGVEKVDVRRIKIQALSLYLPQKRGKIIEAERQVAG